MDRPDPYTYLVTVAPPGSASGRPLVTATTDSQARAWLRDHARLAGDGPVWRDDIGRTYTICAIPRIDPAQVAS